MAPYKRVNRGSQGAELRSISESYATSSVDVGNNTVRGPSENAVVYNVAIALVLILAAALRLNDIERTSIWYDEAISWDQARQPFLDMLAATANDVHPPLHNIILNVTIALFGDSEMALRVPSALIGIATIYLLYQLGNVLWDRITGLIAALLLGLSGFHIWYSTEVRMYALLTFTATWFVIAVVRVAQRPSLATFAGCTAAGTSLLYSHVYGTFIFAGVSLYVWINLTMQVSWLRLSTRAWLVIQATTIGMFLPWAIVLLHRAKDVMEDFWIDERTVTSVVYMFVHLAGGRVVLAVFGAFILVSLVNVPKLYGFISKAEPEGISKANLEGAPESWIRPDWRTGLVLTWLLAPFLVGYTISVIGQPILITRYLIGSLPALLLLAAHGLTRDLDRRVLAVLLVLLGVILWPSLLNRQITLREDYRSAMREFAMRYLPSDRVIYVRRTAIPSKYYYREPIPHQIHRSRVEEVNVADMDADRVWLIVRSTPKDLIESFNKAAMETHTVIFSDASINVSIYLFKRDGLAPLTGSYLVEGAERQDL